MQTIYLLLQNLAPFSWVSSSIHRGTIIELISIYVLASNASCSGTSITTDEIILLNTVP